MSNKKSFEKIEKGINAGIYKVARLHSVDDTGKKTVVYTWSKPGIKEVKEKIEFIKLKLPDLTPGKYLIEVGQSHTSGMKESFPIEITERKYVSFTHSHDEIKKIKSDSEEPITPETMATEIEMEDYIATIRENEKLRAENNFLILQIEALKNTPAPVGDAAPSSGVWGMISEQLPTALSVLDKFLSQKDRSLSIKERELSLQESGLSDQRKKKVRRVNTMNANTQTEVTREQILQGFRDLEKSNPDAFENELDILENKDPELYEYICTEMGLFDDPTNEGGQE